MEFGRISATLITKDNTELHCIEVIDLGKNLRFLLDYNDAYILNDKRRYTKKVTSSSNDFINTYYLGSADTIPLSKVIMAKEIEEYQKKYNRPAIVVRKNLSTDPFDYRRCNLEVVSYRANSIKSISSSGYIGVFETKYHTFQMTIEDPSTKDQLVKFYNTAEEAALMYDYCANKFYPDEKISNFHLNKYPEGYLESRGIKSIDDIPYIDSRVSHSTASNMYGWSGLRTDPRNSNKVIARVRLIDGKYKQIESTTDTSTVGLLKLAAARQEYIDRFPNLVNPNIVSDLYPDPRTTDKLVVIGILKPRKDD